MVGKRSSEHEDEAKLHSPIHYSTFEVCDLQSGGVMQKNWALSVDQCWLKMLQFSGYRTDLLSILLKWNGFTGIQKAVVIRQAADHQTATMTFFWCKLDFRKCFGASRSDH